MPASLQHSLDFLRDLQAHNQREWFKQNRSRYNKAYAAWEDFIQELIVRFDAVDDIGAVSPAQTMYRLNRDVRFSPDKSPYKTWFGALLGTEGRKTLGRSYYVQLAPNDSFLGGGLYMITPAELDVVRRGIADDSRSLRAVLESESFKRTFGTMTGEQLKTAPKGYAKDDPNVDLLRYKQFLAGKSLTDEQVVAEDLVDYTLEVFQALKPFVTYFYDILDEARAEGRL
jgi:uncharacterized protein (TIGR02453 family)